MTDDPHLWNYTEAVVMPVLTSPISSDDEKLLVRPIN